MQKTFDGGFLTGLTRGDHFEVVNGEVSIVGNSFTATFPGEEAGGGTLSVTSPGVIEATSGGAEPDPPFNLFLNASKDIMVATVAESDFNELLILLKRPEDIEQHSIQGRWPFVSYNTPSQVSLLRTDGVVTGASNIMNFEAGTGFLNLDGDGNASGLFVEDNEILSGAVILSNDRGEATMVFPGDPPFSSFTNAGLNVFAAPNSDGSFNELLIGVRSVKPFGLSVVARPTSGAVVLEWVGAPNRRLQRLSSHQSRHLGRPSGKRREEQHAALPR